MYALVLNGFVVQVAASKFEVYSDLQWAPISSDTTVEVGYGATESNGVWTFTAPVAPPQTLAEQAAAALSAGLAITSTSTPALDGTYAVDEAPQRRLNRVSVYLQINGVFPGGSSTITWLDTGGGKHVFDATQFKALASASGDYVAALDDVILGLSTALPGASATIA